MDINSDIVAFQIKGDASAIDPPAEITFQHFGVSKGLNKDFDYCM